MKLSQISTTTRSVAVPGLMSASVIICIGEHWRSQNLRCQLFFSPVSSNALHPRMSASITMFKVDGTTGPFLMCQRHLDLCSRTHDSASACCSFRPCHGLALSFAFNYHYIFPGLQRHRAHGHPGSHLSSSLKEIKLNFSTLFSQKHLRLKTLQSQLEVTRRSNSWDGE